MNAWLLVKLGGTRNEYFPLRTNRTAGVDGEGSRKRNVKRIVLEEVNRFLGIFFCLFIVFGLFVLHEWVVLSSQHINYKFYGFALLNALILAKIILVAEGLQFARRFQEKPIVYPIVAFTILLISAYIVEEVIIGTWHGKSLAQSMPAIGDGTVRGILAVSTIMCIALIPFFAFREMVLGEAELHALVFTPWNEGYSLAPR